MTIAKQWHHHNLALDVVFRLQVQLGKGQRDGELQLLGLNAQIVQFMLRYTLDFHILICGVQVNRTRILIHFDLWHCQRFHGRYEQLWHANHETRLQRLKRFPSAFIKIGRIAMTDFYKVR